MLSMPIVGRIAVSLIAVAGFFTVSCSSQRVIDERATGVIGGDTSLQCDTAFTLSKRGPFGTVVRYPNIAASLSEMEVQAWLVVRIRLTDFDGTDLMRQDSESGFLVPVESDLIDRDWVYQHGIYFGSHRDLRILLCRIGDAHVVVSAADVQERFAEAIGPHLEPYGDELPAGSPEDDLPGHYEKEVTSFKGLVFRKLNGQRLTSGAMLVSGVAYYMDESHLLKHGIYVRSVDQLKEIVLAEMARVGEPVMIHCLLVSQDARDAGLTEKSWHGVFTHHADDDEYIEWMKSIDGIVVD